MFFTKPQEKLKEPTTKKVPEETKKAQLKTLEANTSGLFRHLLRHVKERRIQVWDKKEGPILFLEALEQQKDRGGYSSPDSVSLFYFLFTTDFQSVLIAGFPFSL